MDNYSPKFLLCVGTFFLMSAVSFSQNVAINATGTAANTSAGLDVDFTNKGFLIPRIALTARNSNAPIGATIATALLVYNTATAGAAPNNVVPGFYYWNGTSWIALSGTGGNDWSLTGNSGTTTATNFIGTTDAIDWVIRTTNTERLRVMAGGNVGIGTSAPLQKLDVQGGNARINNAFVGDVGHGSTWGGISHSSMNTTTGYALIESSDGAYTLINKQNTGSGYIGFRIANADVAVITNAGNMGIGTTTPAYRLDLANGTFGFGNSNQRTETRDNAGLQGSAGAQSGFFETSAPSNYPTGAASWWHLIDVRHSNTGNNYAMQLAGSFFDQRLFFRKTNNNAAQGWTEVVTSTNASVIERWVYPPTTINNSTTYTLTATVPGVTSYSSVTVNLAGDWATSPNVTIKHVEARTGTVRFQVQNNSGTTNYTGMDFVITVIR